MLETKLHIFSYMKLLDRIFHFKE